MVSLLKVITTVTSEIINPCVGTEGMCLYNCVCICSDTCIIYAIVFVGRCLATKVFLKANCRLRDGCG